MGRRAREVMPDGTLWCSRGKHFVLIDQFSVKKMRPPYHIRVYYHAWCKACAVAYAKENKY